MTRKYNRKSKKLKKQKMKKIRSKSIRLSRKRQRTRRKINKRKIKRKKITYKKRKFLMKGGTSSLEGGIDAPIENFLTKFMSYLDKDGYITYEGHELLNNVANGLTFRQEKQGWTPEEVQRINSLLDMFVENWWVDKEEMRRRFHLLLQGAPPPSPHHIDNSGHHKDYEKLRDSLNKAATTPNITKVKERIAECADFVGMDKESPLVVAALKKEWGNSGDAAILLLKQAEPEPEPQVST